MRILLADDQPRVRFALRMLLDRQQGLEVIGEAEDALALLVQADAGKPDLVLLDWELPGLNRASTLNRLIQRHPNLLVVALSGRSEARRDALASGAHAFVSKAEPPERLLAAIMRCAAQSLAQSEREL